MQFRLSYSKVKFIPFFLRSLIFCLQFRADTVRVCPMKLCITHMSCVECDYSVARVMKGGNWEDKIFYCKSNKNCK